MTALDVLDALVVGKTQHFYFSMNYRRDRRKWIKHNDVKALRRMLEEDICLTSDSMSLNWNRADYWLPFTTDENGVMFSEKSAEVTTKIETKNKTKNQTKFSGYLKTYWPSYLCYGLAAMLVIIASIVIHT